MKKRTHELLLLMKTVTWILFIGLCMKTGALLISFFVSEFVNPVAAKNLYLGFNLSNLKAFSNSYYTVAVLLLVLLWALEAFMFYEVIGIFSKLNLMHPFSKDVAALIKRISYIALSIGAIGVIATEYSRWLSDKGIAVSNLTEYVNRGTPFLFFAGIIFVISLVFKKGIELQTENELTV